VLRNQPGNDEVRRKLSALEPDEPGGEAIEGDRAGERTSDPVTTSGDDSESGSSDDEDVTLEVTVDEAVEVQDAGPGRTPAAAEPAGVEADFPGDSAAKSKSLDEQKSYEQFKRWLENMKK
jgi:hypothetical protein